MPRREWPKKMHWLEGAVARAGLAGASSLSIPSDVSNAEGWDIASRTLGLAPQELAARVAPQFGLRVAEFERTDPRALALLPERLARRYHVFPLREDDRNIYVATADPTDIEVEHAIGFASGRRPVFELAPPNLIEDALLSGYSADRMVENLLTTVDSQIADAVRVVDELEPEAVDLSEVETGPVVKLTNLILRDAVMHGVSDVHIEPGPKGGTVRFRIDGVMRQHMHLPMAALNRVVSRIKVLARMDIANRLVAQDGRAKVAIEGRNYDLRISTVPTREAEKAVIRVLRPESARKLEEVGVTPRELARLRQLLACRDGIVIVTGPTGSGKTTTLYSAIKEIATGHVNIMTVEDPIEYELPGITQIQVETKRGVTFANSLRAILRQDPDVIFVGEIRDLETAEVAAQAAMTGHLVLATLHTNDSMSAVTRLADLGLDRQTIATCLRGALAQRLVRRVCPDCAQPLLGSLTENEERLSAQFGVLPLSRATGCKRCGNTGYRGRLPLVEVAIVTPSIADMIAGGATAQQLQRAAIAAGMAPLRDVAVARVRRGETTLEEIERVLGDQLEDEQTNTTTPGILVLNPDPAWRRMARALLEGAGFRVSEAMDPDAAAHLMQDGRVFSFVVTEASLPMLAAPRGPGLLTAGNAAAESPVDPLADRPLGETANGHAASEPTNGAGADWSQLAGAVQNAVRRALQ
ncbi:MAG: Flp pilus assembly complex ATPase component TadA [Gemmatimonadota bacterium]|nr:Flp pilus assembly complex ATPase component TadA [Gemmatimonadota bacterium]HEU4988731.1 GspE/PulE family protein [Gemmatimonadaceae bacterium]